MIRQLLIPVEKNNTTDGVFQTDINMNDNRITSLSDPVNDDDATTKVYVDDSIKGCAGKVKLPFFSIPLYSRFLLLVDKSHIEVNSGYVSDIRSRSLFNTHFIPYNGKTGVTMGSNYIQNQVKSIMVTDALDISDNFSIHVVFENTSPHSNYALICSFGLSYIGILNEVELITSNGKIKSVKIYDDADKSKIHVVSYILKSNTITMYSDRIMLDTKVPYDKNKKNGSYGSNLYLFNSSSMKYPFNGKIYEFVYTTDEVMPVTEDDTFLYHKFLCGLYNI